MTANDIFIISYNENERNFDETDCSAINAKIEILKPKFIFLCTQKSKSNVMATSITSNATKHFPHVLQKLIAPEVCTRSYLGKLTCVNNGSYELVHKKDASFIIPGITENNSVRTRIYKRQTEPPNISINNIKFKLSTSSGFGHISELSVNRAAIMYSFDLLKNGEKIKIILINTELSSNLSDRKKEFISLIKEFKLHQKFNEGHNIFFCGSLNFKLYPMNLINNKKSIIYDFMRTQIIKKYEQKNNIPGLFLNKNELYLYIDELISDIYKNNKKNFKSKLNINNSMNSLNKIINNIVKEGDLYKKLLSAFKESIEKINIHLNCNYKNTISKSGLSNWNPLKTGVSIGKSVLKGSEYVHNKIKDHNIGNLISNSMSNNTKKTIPSMSDKILYAGNQITFKEFAVYDIPNKSNHMLISALFDISV